MDIRLFHWQFVVLNCLRKEEESVNHEAPVMDDSVYFDVIPQSSEAAIHSPFEL